MNEIISIFKYLANTNTINFLIMAVLLFWIIKKINLKISLNNSVNEIAKEIKSSEEEKETAVKSFNEAEKTLSQLPQEVKKLEIDADKKSEIYCSEVKKNTQEIINKLNKNIQKSVAREEKKISDEIILKSINNAIEESKIKITNCLKSNPELHLQFIRDSLKELEKAK